MALFEIHQRLKGHFLNELRISFNLRIYDVTAWLANKCNTHTPNLSRNKIKDYNMRNILLQKSYTKCGAETSPRPFSKK